MFYYIVSDVNEYDALVLSQTTKPAIPFEDAHEYASTPRFFHRLPSNKKNSDLDDKRNNYLVLTNMYTTPTHYAASWIDKHMPAFNANVRRKRIERNAHRQEKYKMEGFIMMLVEADNINQVRQYYPSNMVPHGEDIITVGSYVKYGKFLAKVVEVSSAVSASASKLTLIALHDGNHEILAPGNFNCSPDRVTFVAGTLRGADDDYPYNVASHIEINEARVIYHAGDFLVSGIAVATHRQFVMVVPETECVEWYKKRGVRSIVPNSWKHISQLRLMRMDCLEGSVVYLGRGAYTVSACEQVTEFMSLPVTVRQGGGSRIEVENEQFKHLVKGG